MNSKKIKAKKYRKCFSTIMMMEADLRHRTFTKTIGRFALESAEKRKDKLITYACKLRNKIAPHVCAEIESRVRGEKVTRQVNLMMGSVCRYGRKSQRLLDFGRSGRR